MKATLRLVAADGLPDGDARELYAAAVVVTAQNPDAPLSGRVNVAVTVGGKDGAPLLDGDLYEPWLAVSGVIVASGARDADGKPLNVESLLLRASQVIDHGVQFALDRTALAGALGTGPVRPNVAAALIDEPAALLASRLAKSGDQVLGKFTLLWSNATEMSTAPGAFAVHTDSGLQLDFEFDNDVPAPKPESAEPATVSAP